MAGDRGTFGVILDKVAFVNKWPLLLNATSDDEVPTPGYMYQEINKISLYSGSYCQDLLDSLVERLNTSSYNVKLKAIRIMKFVVENGNPDFRQGLRKKSQGIIEATKFGGPPDPLHGMAPYIMVRKEAKELSQLLFEVNPDDKFVPQDSGAAMAIPGGMGGMASKGTLQGFGNNPTKPMTVGESLITGLRGLADKVLEPAPTAQPSSGVTAKYFGQYRPVVTDASAKGFQEWEKSETQNQGMMKRESPAKRIKGHKRGVAGGGWEDEEEEELSRNRSESSIKGRSHSSTVHSDNSGPASEKMDSFKPEEWLTEQQLVSELVNTRDGAIIPQRHVLKSFVIRCSNVNCDKVLEYLNDTLDSENSAVLIRGMLALESLLRTDLVSPDQVTLVCVKHLLAIYEQQNGQQQQKARKILRSLEKLSKHQEYFSGLPSVLTSNAPEKEKTNPHACGNDGLVHSVAVKDNTPTLNAALFSSQVSDEMPALKVPFACDNMQSQTSLKQLHSCTNLAHSGNGADTKQMSSSAFPFLYDS